MANKDRLWIQRSVEKEGALRDTVKRDYGEKGFTERGTIKVSLLKTMSNKRTKRGKLTKTARRSRLALTLRGLRKKKK